MILSEEELTGCTWAKGELYQHYHDTEWGIPCYDERSLFESLCLEGQQAGLSWITVLKKRDNYRDAFHQFDPVKIAKMSDQDIDTCMLNAGLIRHKLKLLSIRANAQAVVALIAEGDTLSRLLWGFVDHEIKVHQRNDMSQVPSVTPVSIAMSKALKKRGFKFLGPTTCYAFMQAVGMVDDHLVSCPCHTNSKKAL
jgi:DNA-3-methyladenine glycosylase I